MKLTTKLAAVGVAASTLGLFGYTAANTGAQAACGSAQGANVFPGAPSPVYTSGPPAAGPNQTGYVGVGGSQAGTGGYLQATGNAGAGGVNGNVTASGSSPARSGTLAVGNDGNEAGTVPANPANAGVCQA